MEAAGKYILTVCSAAIICGIVKTVAVKKGPVSQLIHMLCGVFLAVTAISPLVKLEIRDISSLVGSYQQEGKDISDTAFQKSAEATRQLIIDRAEAYIMDKADSFHASIQVEIILSEESPAVPCSAIISGSVSPYGKTRLTEIMEKDLGISREAQQWMT